MTIAVMSILLLIMKKKNMANAGITKALPSGCFLGAASISSTFIQ